MLFRSYTIFNSACFPVTIPGGNTEKDSEGCPLLGMVRHMDAISNCAPAVSLVTKMIKQAKQAELKIV